MHLPALCSMPGMMNTVLNLGLNDSSVKGLAQKYGKRFAYDCYRCARMCKHRFRFLRVLARQELGCRFVIAGAQKHCWQVNSSLSSYCTVALHWHMHESWKGLHFRAYVLQ